NIGGGSSRTGIRSVPYAQFRAALASETQSADTTTALANLPMQMNNPVNNSPSLDLTKADLRALGIQALYSVTFSTAATVQFTFGGATTMSFTYTPGTTAAQDLQTNLQTIPALDAADGNGNDFV